MNAPQFVALSTKLVSDLKEWIGEASKDDSLTERDLALLQATLSIVERVTYREVDTKPDTDN
jgi:hypothetical protein